LAVGSIVKAGPDVALIVPVFATVTLLNAALMDTELYVLPTTTGSEGVSCALAAEDKIANDAIGINNANGLTEK
jgi:hypothetical protein